MKSGDTEAQKMKNDAPKVGLLGLLGPNPAGDDVRRGPEWLGFEADWGRHTGLGMLRSQFPAVGTPSVGVRLVGSRSNTCMRKRSEAKLRVDF